MKRLASLVGAAALLTGLSAGAASAEGRYVEGSAGVTTQDQLEWGGSSYDMDSGFNAAISVGQSMWTNWDAEIELSYDKMEYSCCNPNNTHEYRLMANLTRNFDTGTSWTPYVGGGLGVADVTYEPSNLSDTVAAYQLIGGVRFAVTPNWSLFGEYRYQDTFSNPNDSLEWEQKGNNFAIGARLNLN